MSVFYNRAKSGKGFPIGSILPWSGPSTEIPRGWITCNNGITLKIKDYPFLYKIIGNTYGGAAGQTFKLPRLNDGTTAAMDLYRGHFYYLQDKGIAHKPENSNISVDAFWDTVGKSLDGNAPSTTQSNWVSSVDVVGELNNIENLSAKYADIVFNPGEYTKSLTPSGRKLSDVHLPSHIHNFTPSNNSYRVNLGDRADSCSGGTISSAQCFISSSCTFLNRAVIYGITGRTMEDMTDPPNEENYFNTFNAMLVNEGYPLEALRWGGGGFASCLGGETSSECYAPLNTADGFTGGDMFAHNGGLSYYWSSLSPSSIVNANGGSYDYGLANQLRSFSRVTDHGHGSFDITFSSKYIKPIKPPLINDVRLNNVRINNDTGLNVGFINVSTATPNLAMQYIIKAF